MKLATLRIAGQTRAARQDGDSYIEIDGVPDVGALLQQANWQEIAATANGATHPVEGTELEAVIPAPSKVLCVGLNYKTHILEMGRELPEYPTLFAKFADTLTGPYDDVELPPEDEAIDWEAELAVVIGKTGRRISEAEAAQYIAGYTVCNDISMRTWQFRTIEWLQGKIWEKSTPLGPVLVTADEFIPGAMIRTKVDGQIMQEASTGDLLFTPEHLVAYISTMITLRPGDVIITGTPGGVGRGRKPAVYLTDGQVVETSIDGLGTLRNRLTAAS